MLERLKNLDVNRIDVTEALSLLAFGKIVRSEFEANTMETPEWLDSRIRELRREIAARNQDATDARLREAKARLEALKPASERRAELEREIAKLEKQMTAAQ